VELYDGTPSQWRTRANTSHLGRRNEGRVEEVSGSTVVPFSPMREYLYDAAQPQNRTIGYMFPAEDIWHAVRQVWKEGSENLAPKLQGTAEVLPYCYSKGDGHHCDAFVLFQPVLSVRTEEGSFKAECGLCGEEVLIGSTQNKHALRLHVSGTLRNRALSKSFAVSVAGRLRPVRQHLRERRPASHQRHGWCGAHASSASSSSMGRRTRKRRSGAAMYPSTARFAIKWCGSTTSQRTSSERIQAQATSLTTSRYVQGK